MLLLSVDGSSCTIARCLFHTAVPPKAFAWSLLALLRAVVGLTALVLSIKRIQMIVTAALLHISNHVSINYSLVQAGTQMAFRC
jgi:hypothetical protein